MVTNQSTGGTIMEPQKQIITKKEFLEELTAMLNVCFEAEAVQEAEGVRLTFPSGEVFFLRVEEAA